jgi:hypothetical protein
MPKTGFYPDSVGITQVEAAIFRSITHFLPSAWLPACILPVACCNPAMNKQYLAVLHGFTGCSLKRGTEMALYLPVFD